MLDFELYLKPFVITLLISVGIIFLLIRLTASKRFGVNNRIEKRHSHKGNKSISRMGGVAIIVAFVSAIIIDQNLVITKVLWGIIFGGVAILVFGLIDDIKEINWKTQLFFQTCVASLIFIFGARINYITNPFGESIQFDNPEKILFGIILGIIWTLIVMNAMNWLDGIDGLSSGISFIGAITIFILSLRPEVNQPPVGIIAIALTGSLLGFLIMNFPPAKIMAGTSGAFFMGFILAGLSVFAGTKIATTLLVLSIPIIDFFWVISRRIKLKKSIFEADQEHLHHKLMKIGWSQRKINLFFYTITILIATIALNIGASGKAAMILLLIILATLFFYMINNYRQNAKSQ